MVAISATANSGYTFTNWSGSVASPSSASTTVTMGAPQTVTANFITAPTAITIQTNPSGRQFSVDGGATQSAPQTLSFSQGSHTIAVASPQAGGAGTQYVFTSWSDGGAASHSITVGVSSAAYTASFKTQYQLTTVASPPAGGTVTPSSGGFYDSGSVVAISATANSGYTFTNWTGSVANPKSASASVTMSAPEAVTANFTTISPPGLVITTTSPLPTGQVNVAYSQTLAASGGTPPYASWVITGGAQPPGLSLSSGGALSGTPTTAGTYTFAVRVTDSASATASASFQLTISPPGLVITTTSPLLAGQVNVAYSQTLGASGGTPPYASWVITGGTQPPGLSLSSGGVLAGTPTTAGTYTFAVRVTDSASTTASASFQLTISPPGLVITTTSPLLAGQVNAAYSQTLAASGGTPPYTSWVITGGAQPPGLSFSSGGVLSGTPTTAGTFSFTVKVSDSSNPPQSATAPLTVTIQIVVPPITLTGLEAPAVPTRPVSVGLQLSAPAPMALQGELSLSFRANAAGVAGGWADPALQFASGGTTLTFAIPAGATTATMPQSGAIQQGTVAGDITVTLTRLTAGTADVLHQTPINNTVTVGRLAPLITVGSVRLINVTTTGFTVELVGYSTPRDLTSATFTFSAAAGAQIQGSASFTVPVSDVSTQWYASDPGRASGSAFTLRVPFPLSGDPSAVQAVTATLTNSVGTSTPETGVKQ